MSAPYTSLPQRPGTTPAIRRLSRTDVIRPAGRAPSDPPPAVVICDHCGAIEDRPDPHRWLLAAPAQRPYRYGLCPACLSDDSCDAD